MSRKRKVNFKGATLRIAVLLAEDDYHLNRRHIFYPEDIFIRNKL